MQELDLHEFEDDIDDYSALTDASQVEQWIMDTMRDAPDRYARFRGRDLNLEMEEVIATSVPGNDRLVREMLDSLSGNYYWAKTIRDVPLGRVVRWLRPPQNARGRSPPVRLTAGGIVTGFSQSPSTDDPVRPNVTVRWRSCGGYGGSSCRFGQFSFADHLVFVKMTLNEQLVASIVH